MEIKGEEFVKNVQLKQEKEEIKQRLEEINTMESQHIQNTTKDEEVVVDIPEQELGDILLRDNEATNGNKKYFMLGAVMIILFILTVIIIKLLTDDGENENTLVGSQKSQNIEQDKALDNDIEKQYQKIISEKLKKIEKEEDKPKQGATKEEKKAKETMSEIEKIKKELKPIEPPKEEPKKIEKTTKKEILDILKEKQKTIQKTQTEKEGWPRKKSVLKEPDIVDFNKQKSEMYKKPSGIFIQVGAFTKEPSQKYLQTINNRGYNFRLYKVEIKQKLYTKVLVGPFKSKNAANAELTSVRNDLNNPNAYILKF